MREKYPNFYYLLPYIGLKRYNLKEIHQRDSKQFMKDKFGVHMIILLASQYLENCQLAKYKTKQELEEKLSNGEKGGEAW